PPAERSHADGPDEAECARHGEAPGRHPAHARPAEDARGRGQRREGHERRRHLRSPARRSRRAATTRRLTTPSSRPRGLLINVWIAGELVSTLLDRNLVHEGVHSDFYGTLNVIGVWGRLTPSELADRTGTPLTTVSDRLRRMV